MNTAKLQALEALAADLTVEEQLVLLEHLANHVRQSLGQIAQEPASQSGLPSLTAFPPIPIPGGETPALISDSVPTARNRTALDWLDEWLATPDTMGNDWWDAFRREMSGQASTFEQTSEPQKS